MNNYIVHTFELSMSHLFVYRKLRQYAAALVVVTVRPSVKIIELQVLQLVVGTV